jgi:uncharacterized protein YjiS (DUF1127 family)
MNAVAQYLTPAASLGFRARRLVRQAGVVVGRLAQRIDQGRRARATYEVLRYLDARTLRDLGLTRSEVGSVAARVSGRAERARRRIETEFWQSASAGFRVRRVETFLSVAVLAAFACVAVAAMDAPEVLAAWRATVDFI